MDNELTKKIQQWVGAESHDSDGDIIDGATMLLKLNRNRVLFNTILRNPKRYVKVLQYELGKFLRIRLDGLTMNEVQRMDNEITPEVKEAVDAEPKDEEGNVINPDDLPSRNGKRKDHDSLPDDIKAIWPKNAERWKKIKQLYNTLLNIKKPCDRYEYLKQMKDLWYAYKADFAKYDEYDAAKDSGEGGGDNSSVTSPKDVTNARSYISKNITRLQELQKSAGADGADEKAKADYASLLSKVQERVNILLQNNEEIGDDLKQKLTDAGVVFPTADNTADDEQGQEG